MNEQIAVETPQIPIGTAPITTPEAKPVGSETATPAVPETKPAEKTFTQAELEREIGKRLAIQERRRTRELEAQVKALQAAQAPKPEAKASTDAAPNRDQYDSYEDYIEARAAYVAEQKLNEREAAREKAANEAKEKETRESTLQAFDKRREAASAKYPDFEDAVAFVQTLPISDPMFEALTQVEEGWDVIHYFAAHPDEASRISKLPPKAQAVEIGKLAVKVAGTTPAPVAEPDPAKTASVSKAPAPIVPGGSKATVQKDPKDMSYDEFVKFRHRQIAQKR